MAKKEILRITPEGIHLLTVMCYYGYFDGFYGKDIFFTDGFNGNVQYLFQALGNLGAYARKDIDNETQIVIVSNEILLGEEKFESFKEKFEELLNKSNSPYRKLLFMSENQLLWYLEKRGQKNADEQLRYYVRKYKESMKNIQLFTPETEE